MPQWNAVCSRQKNTCAQKCCFLSYSSLKQLRLGCAFTEHRNSKFKNSFAIRKWIRLFWDVKRLVRSNFEKSALWCILCLLAQANQEHQIILNSLQNFWYIRSLYHLLAPISMQFWFLRRWSLRWTWNSRNLYYLLQHRYWLILFLETWNQVRKKKWNTISNFGRRYRPLILVIHTTS